MSEQIISYGAVVERSVDGVAWARIPECKGIAIPVVETEYVEVTNLDSPGGFKEYIKGLKDAGVLAVPCGYTAAGYEQQVGDQGEPAPMFYRTTLPTQPLQATGDVFEFRGFPTPELEPGDTGQIVGMSVSIRTTGDVAWTRGTDA